MFMGVIVGEGSVIVTVSVVVQLLASVIFTLYVPIGIFVMSSVVALFDQLYE